MEVLEILVPAKRVIIPMSVFNEADIPVTKVIRQPGEQLLLAGDAIHFGCTISNYSAAVACNVFELQWLTVNNSPIISDYYISMAIN